MKVFLDTNVLASAVATRGLCADVFREVIHNEELISSEYVLDELQKVLTVKFKLPLHITAEAIALIKIDSVIACPITGIECLIEDENDIPILSAAVTGKADVFITGDKLLLGLKKIGSMEILSPREFWRKLKE